MYKRVLLKLSGEALGIKSSDNIIDVESLNAICERINVLHDEGLELGRRRDARVVHARVEEVDRRVVEAGLEQVKRPHTLDGGVRPLHAPEPRRTRAWHHGGFHHPCGMSLEVELRAAVAVPHVLAGDRAVFRDLRAQGVAIPLGVHLCVDVFDDLDLLRIVGTQRRTEEVVEPLRHLVLLPAALLDLLPHAFPRLVGLVLACDESPAGAADALLREERVAILHIAPADARKPLRVDHRTAKFFLDFPRQGNLRRQRTVCVVADDVAPGRRHALCRLQVRLELAVPDVRRARLLHADFPRELKHLLDERCGDLAAIVVARLVPDVPEEDAVVVFILHHDLLAHLEELRLQLRIVRADEADRAGEAAMLAQLASAVVAPVAGLRPGLRNRPQLLRTRTVVAEADDRAHLVLRAEGKEPLEVLHEVVVLVVPRAEAVLLQQHAQGVESDRLRKRQFAVHLLEALLAAVLLPHVEAVRRARRHVVAATDPRLGVVPLPRLPLRPGASAPRERRQGRTNREHNTRQLHDFHSDLHKGGR